MQDLDSTLDTYLVENASSARSTWSVRKALEMAGIEFLDGDGDWRVRGDGVRFCKDRTGRLRREIVEDLKGWLDVCLMLADVQRQIWRGRVLDVVIPGFDDVDRHAPFIVHTVTPLVAPLAVRVALLAG